MDGVPFRKLGDENGLSGKQVYTKVVTELNQLPNNTLLTKTLCDPKRFCGILVMDGKYVAVKDFSVKIPFIYALDYLTHDIPYGHLYVAEDEMSFSHFFQQLYILGYDIQIVIADDRAGIEKALHKVFPHALLQICHNHYLENIRGALRVRTEEQYRHFFNSLKLHVFTEGRDEESIDHGLTHVLEHHAEGNARLEDILWNIRHREDVLFASLKLPGCPNNTNLIELYNSHLNGRLKTVKGFQSFQSAQRWLNAYLVRRRTKLLTDCAGKFRYLNKHCSLEFTIKKQALWPEILIKLGVKMVSFFEKNV